MSQAASWGGIKLPNRNSHKTLRNPSGVSRMFVRMSGATIVERQLRLAYYLDSQSS